MALELRQQMKLSQSLVMTQQLQQAIKLLQLSRTELVDTISQELLENPFLEEAQNTNYDTEDQHTDVQDQEKRTESEHESVYDSEVTASADWEDYLGELSSTSRLASSKDYDSLEDINALETRYATKPSLSSHLMWQLRFTPLNADQMDIGEIIIGNLETSGYLGATLEEIAEQADASLEEVQIVLETIQNLDPIGVAASDIKECLLIQIRSLKYDRDPLLVDLITNHLEDLENKRYKALTKKFKIDDETLFEYVQIIKSLNPRPGAEFEESDNFDVVPDVAVIKVGKEFAVVLNDDGMPHLQVSNLYSEEAIASSDAETKDFFLEKQKAATWLIKAIHQRERTLHKVVESIVKYQKDFFEYGISQLKPLILKVVADDINVSESTISRITTNKYVATAHGTFEIKFFFNSALSLGDGSEVGSESVKMALKKIIADENPKEPYSDDRLCEILKEELGVQMARRTVAKYRTALNIPSSSKRREQF